MSLHVYHACEVQGDAVKVCQQSLSAVFVVFSARFLRCLIVSLSSHTQTGCNGPPVNYNNILKTSTGIKCSSLLLCRFPGRLTSHM